MTLKKMGALVTDATGSEETLTLSVVQAVADEGGQAGSGAGATTQIESAYYGKDAEGNPIAVTVSEDQQSLTLKTLQGVNELTVNLVSASGAGATAQLVQGETVLSEAELEGHDCTCVLMIEGS